MRRTDEDEYRQYVVGNGASLETEDDGGGAPAGATVQAAAVTATRIRAPHLMEKR